MRLIDADVSHGALLLERIQPGTPPPGGHDPVSVQVTARLLARFRPAAHGQLPFPALEDIYLRLQSQAGDDADCEQRARGQPDRGAAPPSGELRRSTTKQNNQICMPPSAISDCVGLRQNGRDPLRGCHRPPTTLC